MNRRSDSYDFALSPDERIRVRFEDSGDLGPAVRVTDHGGRFESLSPEEAAPCIILATQAEQLRAMRELADQLHSAAHSLHSACCAVRDLACDARQFAARLIPFRTRRPEP